MVIGNGLVARAFHAYEHHSRVLIFASGVSDSKTGDLSAYTREIELIEQHIHQYPDFLFVYFSTCSVYDMSLQDSLYVQHKLKIESLIQQRVSRYLIFRLSNVVGASINIKTVFHFLAHAIQHNTRFKLWKGSKRNFIDIDDAFLIIDNILKSRWENGIINVANPVNEDISHVVWIMENYFNKKGNYTIRELGADYHIPIDNIVSVIENVGIIFDKDYCVNLLKKYYPPE